MMPKSQLSLTVKQLRKEYGLTQEDLAMKSGVGLILSKANPLSAWTR